MVLGWVPVGRLAITASVTRNDARRNDPIWEGRVDRSILDPTRGRGRPQTLYAIADSPVGLAAWLLDHDPRSLEMIARSFDGVPEGLTPDDVLDNCTHLWLTNTGVSSSRLYRENTVNYFTPKGVSIPVAVSVFPDEIYLPPRSWAEKAYPKLVHFNKVAKGGHFAAWEQPVVFTQELRASFRSLR